MNGLIPWKRGSERNGGLAPISRMRLDWDRMFDRFLDDLGGPLGTFQPSGHLPLDLTETDEVIRVRLEVPGVGPEDIDVNLVGDVLTISGKKDESTGGENQPQGSYYSERTFGSFQRSVKLHTPVDADQIRAEHRHGVLTITLPKAEAVRPKRIEVRSS